MSSGGSQMISPPKPRVRGGARPGAGRKKKQTPLKKYIKSLARFNWRRRLRGKWLKVQKELLILTKNGDFGDEYRQLRAQYTELRKRLGHTEGESSENEESDGGAETDAESSHGHISSAVSSSESEVC